jgi:putative nucleotidyltransferase with HDIG domain
MGKSLSDVRHTTLAILESRVDKIALLPSVVSKLSSLDLDSEDAPVRIEKLARSDPPFALRLMRLANIELNGDRTIKTIPDAIVQVGTRSLAEMIFALSVIEVFVPHTQAQRNLWIHSIQTAVAARRIAVLRPDFGISMEEAFLAGLLHDIGRFIIFEHHPREMAQIDEAEVDDLRDLVALEIKVCGFDHAVLGNIICDKLHLPWTVCEMVRTHHFYHDSRSRISPEVDSLVRLVQEADCLSFGLIRHQSHASSTAEADNWIEQSLRLVGIPELAMSPQRWADEIRNIHRDTRLAAGFIEIAYSD